ncbi:Uncharacterized homolog of phage Mu protein gp47 [Providencia rustigianii]|nr:Uncharacterized homolog of phage Mu protein gp47 [Providencia rustigianii]
MNSENMPKIDYEQVLRESGMPISEDEISQRFAEIVHDEGLITNTSNMSPFWRLINTIVTRPVRWLTDALINVTLKNMYLATASGKWLDVFAWGVNLTRKPATKAKGAIRFYRSAGAGVVTVPAGTLIQTERINGVIYCVKTVETIAIDADSTLVSVIADSAGGAYNLAPGYF